MNEFDNWYRRNPRMNFTECGQLTWKTAKERDRKIWEAALRWVMTRAMYDPDDRGADYGIIPDIDFIEIELQN